MILFITGPFCFRLNSRDFFATSIPVYVAACQISVDKVSLARHTKVLSSQVLLLEAKCKSKNQKKRRSIAKNCENMPTTISTTLPTSMTTTMSTTKK